MGVFHVFYIAKMIPNHEKHHQYLLLIIRLIRRVKIQKYASLMERRRFKFKVPKGLKSIKEEQEANVAFKNLTEELIHLYWINHEGQAIYHGELKPVDRSDKGFLVCTYVTHPWVAIYGKKQALMNGRKYFFPPGNHKWNDKPLGWVRKRWNFLTQDDVDNEEANFEVLILESGNKSF